MVFDDMFAFHNGNEQNVMKTKKKPKTKQDNYFCNHLKSISMKWPQKT